MFSDLLNEGSVDVNKEYPGEEEKSNTLLHLTVQNESYQFTRELLRHNEVDPNQSHRQSRSTPLHIAVTRANADLVKLLVKSGADVNAKLPDGDTALHLAAKRSAGNWVKNKEEKPGMQVNMMEIISFLLSLDNVQFDLENNLGFTPLAFAAHKGTEEVVRMLVDKGACVTTKFVDDEDDDINTVEDVIRNRFPRVLSQVSDKNRQSNNSAEVVLFKLLYKEYKSPGGFKTKLEEYQGLDKKVNLDYDTGGGTMLQYCCDSGHHDLVDTLLDAGADPNKTGVNNKIPPVVWAGHHGYHNIIRVFKTRFIRDKIRVEFAAVDEKSERFENVLHKVLKAESKAPDDERRLRDYEECLKLLLDDNDPDFKNNIAAAINGQDNLGNTPLHLAAQLGNHDAVRKLLRCEANLGVKNARELTPIVHIAPDIMEEFLDDCLVSDGSSTARDFQITFDYSFLGPPRMRQYSINKEHEPFLDSRDDDTDDHVNTKQLPETEPLWYMAQIKEHRHLLSHPTITSFLWMKWRKIRPYFYMNVVFYLLFFSLLTAYILLITNNIDNNMNNVDEYGSAATVKWITFIFLIIFTFKEFLQLCVSYRRYLFSIENLLESSLIIMTFILMFGSVDPDSVKMMSALVLLFSWIEVVFLVGGHPRLSTYISMFNKISFNFTKFLSLFVSIIIGFGLCFFILYHKAVGEKDDEGNEINAYFSSPSKALLKTIIISLTGEIEFENIEFGSWLGTALFLFFVFFIMLVLVNLLNGLAVSDIAQIQKEAEIMSHISRVELMCHIESILLGDPFLFLENFPRLPKVARRLPACNIFSSIYQLSCINKVFGIFGSNNFLLFSKRLWKKEALFYPNKSKKEASGGVDDGCMNCNNLELPETILEAAKTLVIKRNTITEEQEMKKRLKDMEQTLNDVVNILKKLKP